jgi:endonuclease/exonuclease/phosphatase family metal-dependent hydrolase
MVVRVLSWNLFHGRDAPPDPALFTWRSRLLRVSEANETHAQVNRSLREEFASVLARDEWDVALLQEAPPRWLKELCRRARAHGASVLTSRNSGAALRAWLADRNPDLIASNEGGSNQLLVRPPWRIAETRRLTLSRRWPERRRMLWALLREPGGVTLCVANLHGSQQSARTARQVERAAQIAVEWAGAAPLVFGGDLNLRPALYPELFDELRRRYGLAPPSDPRSVDHVLARGLELLEPPRRLDPGWREVQHARGLRLRLSDHIPVAATFGMR